MKDEQPPARPQASVADGRCTGCNRRVGTGGKGGLWRCPYVSCRRWLRGAQELDRKVLA